MSCNLVKKHHISQCQLKNSAWGLVFWDCMNRVQEPERLKPQTASHSSQGRKFETKMSAVFLPLRLWGRIWSMALCWLLAVCWPFLVLLGFGGITFISIFIFTPLSLCVYLYNLSISYDRDISYNLLGSILKTSFLLDYLCKDPLFKCDYILK